MLNTVYDTAEENTIINSLGCPRIGSNKKGLRIIVEMDRVKCPERKFGLFYLGLFWDTLGIHS